jgi:hypothetical protein
MSIINADGLFNGERFERVSDAARYAWPYLWTASNTLGRIELNYHRVVGRAFSRFQHVPTEDEFWGWIREFQAAYLLFVYEVNGSYWGQWETSEKFLPRHKLAADLESPKPDHAAFSAWRDEYIQLKQAKNSTKPIAATNFKNASETFPKDFGKISETLRTNVRGEERVGEELNTCSTDVERLSPSGDSSSEAGVLELEPVDDAPRWSKTEKQTAFAMGFWPAWPRKVAKAEALKAWMKLATSPEAADAIVHAARTQAPQLIQNGPQYCPHAATWLNGRRFEDDFDASSNGHDPESRLMAL